MEPQKLLHVDGIFTVIYFLIPILHYAEGDVDCDCLIVGTRLKPDTAYTITHSSSKYPKTHLAATTKNDTSYSDVYLTNTRKYKDLWAGYNVNTSLQWRLIETEHPGWYVLVNSQFPYSSTTWNRRKEQSHLRYLLALEPYDHPLITGQRRSRMDFFLRPYRPQGVGEYTYQLKMKSKPLAVIKYFTARISDTSNKRKISMEVDMREPEVLTKYHRGQPRFEETLFTFHELSQEYQKPLSSSANCREFEISCLLLVLIHSKFILMLLLSGGN